MRDKWLTKMNGGRLPLEERGMLVTLWDWHQPIVASDDEMAEIMCTRGWYAIARRLADKGKIRILEDGGWTSLQIIMPNEKRRRAQAEAQRRRRERKG